MQPLRDGDGGKGKDPKIILVSSTFLTIPFLNSPFIVGVNPFLRTRPDTETFPLNPRVVSSASAISNGTTRIVSNNYTPVGVVDPDAPGRSNTTSPQTGAAVANVEHHDAVEDVPPSYDESNRMNPVTVVR